MPGIVATNTVNREVFLIAPERIGRSLKAELSIVDAACPGNQYVTGAVGSISITRFRRGAHKVGPRSVVFQPCKGNRATCLGQNADLPLCVFKDVRLNGIYSLH